MFIVDMLQSKPLIYALKHNSLPNHTKNTKQLVMFINVCEHLKGYWCVMSKGGSDREKERRKDIAMIDSRIKDLIYEIFNEKNEEYRNINEFVEETFTAGVRETIASGKEPEEVKDKFLVEDEFKYAFWQLNLNPTGRKDVDWVDLKSNILLQGLKEVYGEIKIPNR